MLARTYRWTIFSLLSMLLLATTQPLEIRTQASNASAQGDCGAPQLVCMAAKNQDLSLTLRDHCRYQQRARVELYKKGKKGDASDLDKLCETTVLVKPSAT